MPPPVAAGKRKEDRPNESGKQDRDDRDEAEPQAADRGRRGEYERGGHRPAVEPGRSERIFMVGPDAGPVFSELLRHRLPFRFVMRDQDVQSFDPLLIRELLNRPMGNDTLGQRDAGNRGDDNQSSDRQRNVNQQERRIEQPFLSGRQSFRSQQRQRRPGEDERSQRDDSGRKNSLLTADDHRHQPAECEHSQRQVSESIALGTSREPLADLDRRLPELPQPFRGRPAEPGSFGVGDPFTRRSEFAELRVERGFRDRPGLTGEGRLNVIADVLFDFAGIHSGRAGQDAADLGEVLVEARLGPGSEFDHGCAPLKDRTPW